MHILVLNLRHHSRNPRQLIAEFFVLRTNQVVFFYYTENCIDTMNMFLENELDNDDD